MLLKSSLVRLSKLHMLTQAGPEIGGINQSFYDSVGGFTIPCL